MKLTKLYIHNYKSFYHTTIEFEKFNIVIGENNSGKSNLIDVLEFVNIIENKGFDNAIEAKNGWEKILNYNYNEENIIIELQLENESFCIKIRFTISKKVMKETIIRYAKYKDNILPLYIDAKKYNIEAKYVINKAYSYKDNIDKLNLKQQVSIIFKLSHILNNISKTYSFNTQIIRDKSEKGSKSELEKTGLNLGKNLFKIKQNYPYSFDIISNSMIGIVNEIDGIDVQETFGNHLIGFTEKDKTISLNTVSDGTINLLATITALNQDEDNSILLAFDEPERYLHLKAINYLVESFRINEKQIIITTHSTEILKNTNLDEIIFIYRDSDGDTQSIKANQIDGLKESLKELAYDRDLTIDELIADRVIGDFE